MNDYPADPPRATITDADRVYPGDGIAPLGELVRILQAIGFHGYFSLELFNRELLEAGRADGRTHRPGEDAGDRERRFRRPPGPVLEAHWRFLACFAHLIDRRERRSWRPRVVNCFGGVRAVGHAGAESEDMSRPVTAAPGPLSMDGVAYRSSRARISPARSRVDHCVALLGALKFDQGRASAAF